MATSSITTPVRVTQEEDIMAICDAYEQSEKELDSFSDFRWMGGKEQKEMREDIRRIFSSLVVK